MKILSLILESQFICMPLPFYFLLLKEEVFKMWTLVVIQLIFDVGSHLKVIAFTKY